jgi:hypothetical protein
VGEIVRLFPLYPTRYLNLELVLRDIFNPTLNKFRGYSEAFILEAVEKLKPMIKLAYTDFNTPLNEQVATFFQQLATQTHIGDSDIIVIMLTETPEMIKKFITQLPPDTPLFNNEVAQKLQSLQPVLVQKHGEDVLRFLARTYNINHGINVKFDPLLEAIENQYRGVAQMIGDYHLHPLFEPINTDRQYGTLISLDVGKKTPLGFGQSAFSTKGLSQEAIQLQRTVDSDVHTDIAKHVDPEFINTAIVRYPN